MEGFPFQNLLPCLFIIRIMNQNDVLHIIWIRFIFFPPPPNNEANRLLKKLHYIITNTQENCQLCYDYLWASNAAVFNPWTTEHIQLNQNGDQWINQSTNIIFMHGIKHFVVWRK